MVEVPIGQRESQSLEFKSSEALKRPFTISREVAAMLNAGGGAIWIGLKEAAGLATEVENVKDVERARIDLWNHLVEVVEPRLRAGDVDIVAVPADRATILRVDVQDRRKQGPFAQLKEGGRYYLIRVDHRIRSMTREEILGPRSTAIPQSTHLAGLRKEFQARGRAGLWVGIEPVPPLRVEVGKPAASDLLLDPTLSGNRLLGWNFRYPSSSEVRPKGFANRLEFGMDEFHKSVFWANGCVEFWTAMEGLHHRTDGVKEIYPLALLEYPVSVARLARTLFQSRELTEGEPEDVFVDAVLVRPSGWRLPAYAPGTYGSVLKHAEPEELADSGFELLSPLRFSWEEFREHPDHAGYMLVRSIYQAFHLTEDRIPSQYDRRSRRLVLDQ